MPEKFSEPGLYPCETTQCPMLLTNASIASGFGPITMVDPVELGLKVAFYFPAICTALIGNIMVIWIILTNEKLRQVNTNLYILNLAIADILVAVFCMWTHLWTKLYTSIYWPHSAAMCKIVFFMRMFVFTTSIFTLVVISFDRCFAIVFPLRFLWIRERKSAICCIVATWAAAITISLPEAVFRQLYVEIWRDRTERLCSLFWPMKKMEIRPGYCRCEVIPGEKVYKVVHIIIVYYIPVVTLFITYSLIVMKLVCAPRLGKSHQHRGRRKAMKLVFAVFLSFLTCWSPMYILNTILLTHNTFETQVGIFFGYVKYITLYVAFLNSALNPLIYAGTNENFREGFIRIFTCCRKNGNRVQSNSPPDQAEPPQQIILEEPARQQCGNGRAIEDQETYRF